MSLLKPHPDLDARPDRASDPLTGLAGRERFREDLLARTRAAAPFTLALLELDGLREHNDALGSAAVDAALERLGERVRRLVAGSGAAYRTSGDELALLVEGDGEASLALVEEATVALGDLGDGVSLRVGGGVVHLPREAADPDDALRTAGRRLVCRRARRPESAPRQAEELLVCALDESRPGLSDHLHSVAVRAEATARLLGLDDEEVERVRIAARLHDVGKLAIPEAILNKPGPLDDVEWEQMKQVPAIGERIVAAAPALRPAAALIRATHERVDGTGYPDGLRGEEIPLGARIVAACDAFDAMVSDRVYGAAMSTEAAVDELLGGSGSDFDPRVVEVFCALVGGRAARPEPTGVG